MKTMRLKNGYFSNLFLSSVRRRRPVGTIYALAVLCSAFFILFISAPVLALSFNDSNWNWHDCDGADDTDKSVTGAVLTIKANGNDVWTNADQYAAYYLNDINGDFEVSVKIKSQEYTNQWAKAGIMVKDDITNDGHSDGYCIVAVTPGNGYAFQWDSNNNGRLDGHERAGSVASSYPSWVKLTKVGTTFTGYYKKNVGDAWAQIKSQTINSAATVQDVGIFVCSHSSGNTCEVEFEDFTTNTMPPATIYTITATAGANGSISPSDDVEVTENADQTFTITPDAGYEVDAVTVDGSPATLSDSQYTFTTVTSDHTINVTFAEIIHTITASTGANGSISPSGTVNVSDNANQGFAVTPDEGYEVDAVTVDGSPATLTNDEYTFENVTTDHTINVTFTASPPAPEGDTGIPGCATTTSNNYSSGFDAADFNLINTAVQNGDLTLETGAQVINPDNIVIPFEQEVFVTFLYEGAGYVSDFGWMFKEDAVNVDGSFKGWNNIPIDKKHPIFIRIYDDNETGGCCGGGNGILDTDYGNGGFPTSSESSLATYDDGTGYPFIVDGDGSVTPRDMKKSLGTIAGGAELVFFLTADKRWNTSDTSGVFFTKKDWNPDTYGACVPSSGDSHWIDEANGIFDKTYQLDVAIPSESCSIDQGWLADPALSRMDTYFGVTLSGTYDLRITHGQKYSHVIVGAPADDPDQWILGWEDLMGAGDADHNDMVFRIERRTGGTAQLESTEAIAPTDVDAYFTAVTLEVYDSMPCTGKTDITYYLSIDNGDNWVEITDWDVVKSYTEDAGVITLGADVSNWTPGSPQCTYRSRRVDFAGKGLDGRALIWKAELVSESEACSPEIEDVLLTGSVATNASFSRASPVVLANVIYSGNYETPAISWTDKVKRGHLNATRLYDPEVPTSETGSATAVQDLWDAGTVLNSKAPSARNIYFPGITVMVEPDEVLGTGNGSATTFSGALAHHPVSGTTLTITDQHETFRDKHINVLEGDFGGTGYINRFTGAFQVTFNSPPGNGVPVKASYSYYTHTGSSALVPFNAIKVTNAMLGLDDTFIDPDGYKYDLDGDGDVDESDGNWLVNWVRGYKDGSSTPKEWLLGPIDHSVPAVVNPPGKPQWYFGTAITDAERGTYDTFRTTHEERQTVVYVGSRDGMLHAFDAGKFRWGDNPDTATITEKRGYFLWEWTPKKPNYGTGDELWAFIPANLISRLKNNLLMGDDQSYVDASPAIADVFINGAWKTVLLAAEGNGGDTVFCLDVTDPNIPSFLWEFADPDLFRSRSSPAVAQIGRIVVGGSAKWAAFFVSGKTYDPTLYPSIYIIDIADGSVIERVFLNADINGIGGVPSGQPAIVDSDGNGYIDRLYIGTDRGFMYKVNIPDDPEAVRYNIAHCVINTDFADDDGNTVPEAQRVHPIYASPAVIVDNSFTEAGEISYNIKIFFGTGDSPYYDESINTTDTTYYFFAYSDQDQKGECNESSVVLDWFYGLPAGHRIFASAFSAAGNIYFGTSTAETEDPCEGSNEGKIYGFGVEGGSPVLQEVVGNITTAPLVEDKHLYLKTPTGMESRGGGQYDTEVSMGGVAQTTVRSWREIF